jgi:DNA-binding LacI/PurR family transcriptional regulator
MSLKEIARIVGVSPSTVSRVLNGKSGSCASRPVRDAIFDAAAALNYRPNQAARLLRTGEKDREKPLRAAIILARIRSLEDDPFFLELYRALKEELYLQGFRDAGLLREEEDFSRAKADGFLILGRCSDALLGAVRTVTRNVVGVWRNPLNFELDEVVCDGAKAAAMAMEHLLALGHKKIAYIGDCSYESRYVGYCETLIRHNIPINYQIIFPIRQHRQAGYEAMEKLLAGGQATAVLCANDISAVGALAAQKSSRARRKPCVISIDDIEQAQETRPLLTTVHIPRRDMAHMAVLLLRDRIGGGHRECLRVEFPGRLVERESVWPL